MLVAVAVLGATATACDQGGGGEAATTTRTSAVTTAPSALPPSQPSFFRASDIGPAPGLARVPAQQIARPSAVPASQNPAHFRNKAIKKEQQPVTGAPLPPVPAAYVAKQTEYLRQWSQLQPTIANLPIEEQDARRAALKRSVLGD
jgi:hypothetical protein